MAAEDAYAQSTVHALLVPWTGQGHITPMVQLAQLLASAGFRSTIVYSARTHARLLQAASPDLSRDGISVEIIPDGLPSDLSLTPSFQEALASHSVMQTGLEQLVGGFMAGDHPVSCLISGTFCPWTRPVTDKFEIPRVEMWSSLAIIYSAGFHHHRLVEEGFVPFKGRREETWITCIPGVPPLRASDFPREFLPESEPERTCEFLKNNFGNATAADRILVNSIYDLESSAFDALQAAHVRAYAVGPLFLQNLHPSDPDAGARPLLKGPRASMYKEDEGCLGWLDGRPTASTLYVAFGSDSKMSKADIEELAMGLEASEQGFLWVIRPGSVVGESDQEWGALPEGFRDRTEARGMVVTWAPQAAVLAHAAVGGFMSHCGWNSSLETVWHGVPVIAWPQRADQGVNKKMMEEEWQMGICVQKNADGAVGRAAVEKAVRALMQGPQGSHAKRKVLEMRELAVKATQEGGSSKANLEAFFQFLRDCKSS